MGCLRLLLALGVVRAHRPFFDSPLFIQGGTAVIFFYVISGFYMSLVVAERYCSTGHGWQWRFLWQRVLRLYPSYWVVLALSIIIYAALGQPTVFTAKLDASTAQRAWTILSNIVIVGMDALVSLDFVLYQTDADKLAVKLKAHFPVLTAWTIAVELTFYVFAAAFALRDNRSALVALMIGVYFRLYFYILNAKFWKLSETGLGYANSPWGYHFFANVLVFFMLGWIAYQLFRALERCVAENARMIRATWAAVAALGVALFSHSWRHDAFQTIADYSDLRLWQALPVFVLLLPPLFLVTRNSRVDNFLGSLSYPVYLCHLVACDAATGLFGLPSNPLTTTLAVSGMSILLVLFIERPMDRWRHKIPRSWSSVLITKVDGRDR